MEKRIALDVARPGWVLVESRFFGEGDRGSSGLLVRRRSCPETVMNIPLPVTRDGRIHELVELPADLVQAEWRVSGAEQHGGTDLKVRPVSWIERNVRMAYRVLRNWARLSAEDRVTCGLTLPRILTDLPEAYRIATGFRGHLPYPDWIERFDTLDDQDRSLIRAQAGLLDDVVHFHVVVMTARTGDVKAIEKTLDSLRSQFFRGFDCVVVDGGNLLAQDFEPGAGVQRIAGTGIEDWLEAFNALLAQPGSRWVMLLRAGDVLPPHALYWFAGVARDHADATVLYADDDVLDAAGRRCDPRFKPDWSLAHLRATHFVGDAAVLRGDAVAAAGGVSAGCCRHGNFDLLLRVVDAAGEHVRHVPAVLLHAQRRDDDDAAWSLDAVRRHLARNNLAAEVSATRAQCRRVRHRLPEKPPLVSIIVPTRDAVSLLRQCIESLRQKTGYPCYEILVVDNQSADPPALAYLEQIAAYPAVRVLRYNRPFNFSAINNFAAREARGEMLCLLNNDTEVIAPDWLDEMAGHLLQPGVGIVGAKLLFPDGRVQHAGDAVGPGGCANHLHSMIGGDDPGYCNRAVVAQELSAVTAACLLTRREVYRQLGGLDEKDLAVAFNDVDYCLRVRAAGYRVVWTPHAVLCHHESVSRGKDDSWRRKWRARHEVVVMRRRWKDVMRNDPFYNPNLSYQHPDFSPSRAPRVRKPWREA